MEPLPGSEAGSTPTYTIFRNKHGIPQFEPKRGTQALKDALIYAFPTLETELQLMQAALRKFFDAERGSRSVFELPENDLQTGLARGKDTQIGQVQPGKAALRNFNFSAGLRTPSMSSWRSSTRPSSRASSRASSRTSTSRISSRAESPFLVQDGAGEMCGGGGIMTTWMLSSGQELEKRRRQPYDPAKRRRVAENRGNACERHRASKTAVSRPCGVHEWTCADFLQCDPDSCPQNKLYGKAACDLRKSRGSMASQSSSFSSRAFGKDSVSDADSPWDASDESMAIDDPEIEMNFDGTHANLSSTGWDESDNVPWHSLSSQVPVPGIPSETGHSIFYGQTVPEPIMEISPKQLEEFNSVAPFHEQLPDQTVGDFPQVDLWQPSDTVTSDEPFLCNEDPFMGWASKRATKAVDDYGWVLSHVETL